MSASMRPEAMAARMTASSPFLSTSAPLIGEPWPARPLAPIDRAGALKALEGMIADLEGPDAAIATPDVARRARLLRSAIEAWTARDLTVAAGR